MATRAAKILTNLGRALEIDDLEFDEDGYCYLGVSRQYSLIIEHASKSLFMIYGVLGHLSEDVSPELLLKLLAINVFLAKHEAPAIAYASKQRTLLLVAPFDIDDNGHRELMGLIERMIQAQKLLCGFLENEEIELKRKTSKLKLLFDVSMSLQSFFEN